MKKSYVIPSGKALSIMIMISFSLTNTVFSQDLITKISGEVIKAKIIEIGVSEISYKKFQNLNGPSYIIPISEINKIIYENGSEDIFTKSLKNHTEEKELNNEIETTSQTPLPFKPHLMGGFNVLAHNGIYGGAVPARPDRGTYHSSGGDPYTGIGFGVNFDYRFLENISLHFDINNYTSSTPVAFEGGYAASDWIWEMTDYSSRIAGPFTKNANYNINTTGMRLGLRVYPINKPQFQPWVGMYYGYYTVVIGIYSDDKQKTWGNTYLDATGLTYLNFGVDFWDKSQSAGGTIFVELGSPVVKDYQIENCINDDWTFQDYGEGFHIFGYYRIGLTLNFVSKKKSK